MAPKNHARRRSLYQRKSSLDYRVELGFNGLPLDRSAAGGRFGANGSCQCLLTIFVVVSFSPGAVFRGLIAIGVTIVFSDVGSV
jgi:hypothetical protein